MIMPVGLIAHGVTVVVLSWALKDLLVAATLPAKVGCLWVIAFARTARAECRLPGAVLAGTMVQQHILFGEVQVAGAENLLSVLRRKLGLDPGSEVIMALNTITSYQVGGSEPANISCLLLSPCTALFQKNLQGSRWAALPASGSLPLGQCCL
jgi:hypothetical protein